MPDLSKPPRISPVTINRRSVLEWLGGGAVLALSGLSPGCSDDSAPALHGADSGAGGLDSSGGLDQDTTLTDAPVGPGDLFSPDASFPFAPGPTSHKVYSGWGERTVDPQDLKKILASWKLRVDGMVDKPRTFTFAELVGLERFNMVTDFHCVEGWSIYDVPWDGVRFSTLLNAVKPQAKATHVAIHTVGSKYNDSVPISVAREARSVLGYGIGGNTLPLKHGFPLRAVIPRLLGYKNAKYIDRIELTDKVLHGFWVNAGYPYAGEVPKARLRAGKY